MLNGYGIKWGPSGEIVYNRTYSRKKLDGSMETWPETVARVVDGNLALVDAKHILPTERDDLISLMEQFKLIPGGRHLWMSGVPGRQFLFNCHVSGWTKNLEDHFSFTFLRLMEGGGVGANYSTRNMGSYPISRTVEVFVVCDPSHPDYEEMKDEGLLTDEFSSDWTGSIEVEDSREGWDEALRDLFRAATGRTKHSKRVYDVSRVRWKGARIKSFGGTASGPLPLARMLLNVGQVLNNRFSSGDDYDHDGTYEKLTPLDAMEIDHEIAQCVVSGGVRRSARMSILHWKDPWIAEFIACKSDHSKHWTTNISVEIDDEFIEFLSEDCIWPESEGDIEDRRTARDVFDAIAAGMLENGEPGIWNSSLSNKDEPNYVEATNPCGEITLEAWENCNLGHINLDAFHEAPTDDDVWKELLYAHKLMTRFLIRATYGDIQDAGQRSVVDRNRRIGVGHFGVAGYLAKNQIKFSESHKNQDFKWDLKALHAMVRSEANAYASRLRIPAPVKTTTVAPTGTIAKMPGRTEGIHPVMYKYFLRRIRFSTIHPQERKAAIDLAAQGYHVENDLQARDTVVVTLPTQDSLVDEVNALGYDGDDLVEDTDEISIYDMLAVQAMYQEEYADNAVSFTINIPQGRYTVEDLKDALRLYLPRLKGTTIFPETSRPQAPYQRITREQYEKNNTRVIDSSVDDDCASGACPVR